MRIRLSKTGDQAAGSRHDSAPLLPKRSGRARDSRASPGCMCCYRFDETGCPARPFSTRPPTGGPASGPLTDRPEAIAGSGTGRPYPRIARPSDRTSRRAASKQAPSIDAREDPRTLRRPGFIARPQPAAIEERGSDALPTDGMPLSYSRLAMGRVQDADSQTMRSDYSGLASKSMMAAH